MHSKGPISPSSRGNSRVFVIFDAFSLFVVTNTAPHISYIDAIQTYYSINGLLNLAHIKISSLIEVLNIIITKWLFFTHSLV